MPLGFRSIQLYSDLSCVNTQLHQRFIEHLGIKKNTSLEGLVSDQASIALSESFRANSKLKFIHTERVRLIRQRVFWKLFIGLLVPGQELISTL
jgi:hypothetical protein